MLFSLAVKNLKKSTRDYLIYFFTLVLGIGVFYIFNAIETQTAMLEISRTKALILDTMNAGLSSVSFLVSLTLGYLIVYASRFMLKKRKKEFAVYLTLGMGKGRIAVMLWMETAGVGVISLAVGLLAGAGLSQLMSLAVANLFQADVSRYAFVFSGKAAAKSIGYFLVIYLVVMVFNTWGVGRAKLIDFMTDGRKKEKNLLKHPLLSGAVFLFAWILLGTAYYNVTANQDAMGSFAQMLQQIAMGIAGTFLVFWSLAGLLAWGVRKLSGVYYRKLNSFVFAELSAKLNSTVASCSIICLLLFMTVCIFFTAISRKEYKDQQLKELAPADLSLSKGLADGSSIEEMLAQQGIGAGDWKEQAGAVTWQSPEVTNRLLLGDLVRRLDYGEFADQQTELIHVSDYNRMAEFYRNPCYTLKEDEFLMVAEAEGFTRTFDLGMEGGCNIELQGRTLHARETVCQEGFLMMSYDRNNTGFLLIPDSIQLPDSARYKEYLAADYADSSAESVERMEEFFQNGAVVSEGKEEPVRAATRRNIADDSIGTSAMYIFLGLYVGICFLISGSAVLALKMLSDAADSREKYRVLRKLGCSQKAVFQALGLQNGILFFLPLLLAGIHSVFGIQVCMNMLSIYQPEGLGTALAVTLGLLAVIYGGYFLLAQAGCRKVIKE